MPGVADGDVQAEREQHVEERVEADADHVVVVRPAAARVAAATPKAAKSAGVGSPLEPLPDLPDETRRGPRGGPRARRPTRRRRCAASPRLRRLRADGSGPGRQLVRHQTLFTAAFPKRPVGRRIIIADQDHEHDRVLERRREVAGRERLGQPDHEPADDGARQVADAADDRGRERLQAGVEAHVRPDLLVDETVEDAGRAGERRADEERRGDHAVHVDAHHLRRLAVERDGAHRAARAACARRSTSART